MIKKTKNAYKEIAEEVDYALEYNKNVKSMSTPINTVYVEISRGLYNCGTDKIFNELCKEMGYTDATAPFYIEIHDNEEYCQLFIKFGEKPKRYGMEH